MAEKDGVDEIRKSIAATVVSVKEGADDSVVKEEIAAEPEVKEPEVEAEAEVEVEAAEGEEEAEIEVEAEDPVKLKKTIERLQKRIGKTVGERETIKKELAEAKAALAAKPDGEKVLTEADVETRADKLANERMARRQLVNDGDKIFDEAVKLDKTFKLKVDAMVEDIGGIPPLMVGIVADFDNCGAVMNYLTDNTDEAEKLYVMSDAKMAVELTKLSTKLSKPKIKPISKTPDPHKTLGGNGARNIDAMPDPKDTEKYIEWRNRDIANKRAAGKVNLR